jgi:hypothetical protein
MSADIKVEIEEILNKLKNYREVNGTSIILVDETEILYEGIEESRFWLGVYDPEDNRIYIRPFTPLPIYESEGNRALEKSYPQYWEEIKTSLMRIIKYPYKSEYEARELKLLLKKIEEDAKAKEDKIINDFPIIVRKIRQIIEFLDLSPEWRLYDLFKQLSTEAHEIGHSILHNSILGKEYYDSVARLPLFDLLDEGYAGAFSFRFLLEMVIKGYLPYHFAKEYILGRVSSCLRDNLCEAKIKLFSIDKAARRIKSISEIDFKSGLQDALSIVDRKMKYMEDELTSSIPFEDESKILAKIIFSMIEKERQ